CGKSRPESASGPTTPSASACGSWSNDELYGFVPLVLPPRRHPDIGDVSPTGLHLQRYCHWHHDHLRARRGTGKRRHGALLLQGSTLPRCIRLDVPEARIG
ncbi:fumA, partial [Symbiodinium pilosum]